MLELIAQDHKHWIKVVNHFGEYEMAEDLVQEMYLRVNKYANTSKLITDGKVNGGYVRFVLMSITYDYHKSKKKLEKIRIGEGFEIEDTTDGSEEAYGTFLERLDAEMNTWHWFDRQLFKIYINEEKSMRDLAEGTTISCSTIFNTLKNCKQRLKDNLGESWDDFKNNDWELI
jgi:RNA polymerase sigma factor (sigma-70 family)